MVQCALCGFVNETEVVSHINQEHDLKSYLNIFADLPVVCRDLFTSIENAVYFQFQDDTAGLDLISKEDRELIVVSSRNHSPMRSEIVVESDF